LIPGLPQFSWRQRERGLVFLGSFVSGIATWLWTWGSWLSGVFLAFVFLTHVVSIADVVRQSSFPAYCRHRAWVVIVSVLGTVLYLPVLCAMLVTAWPGVSSTTESRYLVNCWAYRHARPRPGDWVWVRMPPSGTPHGAEVMAVGGQMVQWTGRKWLIDGRDCPCHSPLGPYDWPQTCRFQVPEDQVFVEPETDGPTEFAAGPPILVRADRIIGKAWARYYPVWERHVL
jgi:hypothetical protein